MKKKESPYPKSTFNYKPLQRADNKVQGLEIEWMNIPNKPPLEDWIKFDEYVTALEEYLQLCKEFIKK